MYITIEKEVPITDQIAFQRGEIEKMKNMLWDVTTSELDKKILRASISDHRLELNKLLRS